MIRGKTEGVTPGFRVRDTKGDVYVIKFNPKSNPEMSTAAEVISTKLLYALGCNTPENRIVFFEADRLRIGPDARVSDALGSKRSMTQADVDDILDRVSRDHDGKFRALRNRLLSRGPRNSVPGRHPTRLARSHRRR